MPRRKPPLVPLSDVIGEAVKDRRTEAGWTQEELADRMKEAGFQKWSRPTVTEVENKGRQVSVSELLTLASVFGVSIDRLIWKPGSRLEIAKGGLVVDNSVALLALVVDAEAIGTFAEGRMADTAQRMFAETYKRLTDAYQERVEVAVAELRSTASYMESDMLSKMRSALFAPLSTEEKS